MTTAAADRQRRYRQRQQAGVTVARIAVPAEVAAQLAAWGFRGLSHFLNAVFDLADADPAFSERLRALGRRDA